MAGRNRFEYSTVLILITVLALTGLSLSCALVEDTEDAGEETSPPIVPSEPTNTPVPSIVDDLPQPLDEIVSAAGTWSHFTSGNRVEGVAAEASGLVWAVTRGGIVVWDVGTGRYIIYDSYASLDDFREVVVDASGGVWFAWLEVLIRYDPVSNSWQRFSADDGLLADGAYDLVVGADGVVWVAQHDGVCAYDVTAGTWTVYDRRDDAVSEVWFDFAAAATDGTLFFAGRSGELARYDPVQGSWDELVTQGLEGIGSVYDLSVDLAGAVWMPTRTGGVLRYIPALDEWEVYSEEHGLVSDFVSEVATGADGNLWFATPSGVNHCDAELTACSTYTRDHGLPRGGASGVEIGPDGTVWLETDGGLARFDVDTDSWEFFLTKGEVTDNSIADIEVGSDGELWLAIWDGGVVRHDPHQDSWRAYGLADGLASLATTEVEVGDDGTVWVASGTSVSRYQPAIDAWETFTTSHGLPLEMASCMEVAPDGTVWFGTTQTGVTKYDPDEGSWTNFSLEDREPPVGVTACAIDQEGNLYFGIWDDGLLQYQVERQDWAIYDPGVTRIRAIAVAEDGVIWLGTDEGVARYDPGLSTWRIFTTEDGIGADFVQELAISPSGEVWAGTIGGGTSRYLAATGQWQTLDVEDGLLDVNVKAIAFEADGTIWFGTMKLELTSLEGNRLLFPGRGLSRFVATP